MATPSNNSELVDDPLVKIYLNTDLPGHLSSLPLTSIHKSKLVKHSGFFRAMFRHDFAENRSNIVTLHDDDPRVLTSALSAIECGSIEDWPLCGKETPCSYGPAYQLLHDRLLVQMVQLFGKYDCPGLQAQAVEKSACCFELGLDYQDSEENWFKYHYYPMVAACGGVYPERLYGCFARAWRLCHSDAVPAKKFVSVVKATPDLATHLAIHYFNVVYRVRQAEDDAREAIDEAFGEPVP